MVPYTSLPHPPYYPLNGGAGREKFWGRAAAGRWLIFRRKKKKRKMMMRGTGKRNLGAASELHWPPASSQPHFSGFFPHQSDTRLHHPSLTLSLGLYGNRIYGNPRARIVGSDNYAEMLIEIMHLPAAAGILCKLTFSLFAFVWIPKRFIRIKFNHLQRPSRGQ